MRKQNNADPKDYIFDIAKSRWEFLRRNKKYIEDYYRDGSFPRSYWIKKYGVWPPLSPDDRFPKSFKACQNDDVLFDEMSPIAPIVIRDIRNTPITGEDVAMGRELTSNHLKGKDKRTLRKALTLTLLVDVTHRERLILSEFKKLISFWKKIRRTENRNRCEAYKQYLRVYDAKERGWSWAKLAQFFYPNDAGTTDYAKQKVMRDYKRCVKLINGGYRQIK